MSESDAMMARLVRQLELGRRRLAEEVGENQPTHILEQVYKKDADRTLLPRLNELYEIIKDFKDYLDVFPRIDNTALRDTFDPRIENIREIIQYYDEYIKSNLSTAYRYKIVNVDNFNNEEGNVLVNQLFSEIEKLLNYYQKQGTAFEDFYENGNFTIQNAIEFGVDIDIHDYSIILCDNIMSFILILKEYIETQFLLTSSEAKGRKRCKNGTRKNKKTGKCEKTKSKSKKYRKSGKSKKKFRKHFKKN